MLPFLAVLLVFCFPINRYRCLPRFFCSKSLLVYSALAVQTFPVKYPNQVETLCLHPLLEVDIYCMLIGKVRYVVVTLYVGFAKITSSDRLDYFDELIMRIAYCRRYVARPAVSRSDDR